MLLPRLDATLWEELAKAQREVLIASPFLTMPVAQELKAIQRHSRARWTVLTRLDARSVAARVLSTGGLTDLIEQRVQVVDVTALHAKVFLADDFLGVVGSANLTGAGLGSATRPNVELSVRLDPDQVPELRATVQQWLESARPMTLRDVRRTEEEARRLPRPVGPLAGDLEPAAPSSSEGVRAIAPDATLWVKAQHGGPDWEQWRGPHWFSSRADRHPGFEPGDLAVIYAQDVGACYAVVEVTDEPTLDPDFVTRNGDDGTRWPWVNHTRPFLIPPDGRRIPPHELGFDGRGLQNGNKKLDLTQFLTALDALGSVEDRSP